MRYLKIAILLLALLVSLYAVVMYTSMFALLLLVPWDVSFTRPDVGTWQRTLNDFFEGRMGEMVMVAGMTLFFGGMTLYTLKKCLSSILRVIVANLLMAFSLFIVGMLSLNWADQLFPYIEDFRDPFYFNYPRHIIPMIVMVLLIGIWWREMRQLQKPRISRKAKAKHHATQSQPNVSRLVDDMPQSMDDLMLTSPQDNHLQHG